MEKIIYANGTAEVLVPAGQKIAIATYGNEYATLSFKRGNNLEFIQRLDNSQVTLGPWTDVRTVNIEAAQDPVYYDVGTAPSIESNVRMSSNPFTGKATGVAASDGSVFNLARGTSILNGASAGADSGWLAMSDAPERFAYQLDSGTTTTTFSVDISADGVNSLGQAFTGTWASSTLAEITPPIMFSNPLAKFFRWNVLSGGPLSVSRGV